MGLARQSFSLPRCFCEQRESGILHLLGTVHSVFPTSLIPWPRLLSSWLKIPERGRGQARMRGRAGKEKGGLNKVNSSSRQEPDEQLAWMLKSHGKKKIKERNKYPVPS